MARILAILLSMTCVPALAQEAAGVGDATTHPLLDEVYASLEPGPRGVDAVAATLVSPVQGERALELLAYAPREGGPYPLVLLSHGMGRSERDYRELARFWASHEYVVILPRHEDLDPPESWERRTPLPPQIDYLPNSAERARDLARVLEGLDTLADSQPRLEGRLDAERVAVAGHSFGTLGAQLVAGVLSSEETLAALDDARVDALLLMAAFGRGSAGFDESSWSEISVPLLALTGSDDPGPFEGDPLERLEPALLAPSERSRAFLVRGADHFAYLGSQGRASPRHAEDRRSEARTLREERRRALMRKKPGSTWTEDEIDFAAVCALTLAFLDAALKNESEGRAYLDADPPAPGLAGRVERVERVEAPAPGPE